MRRLKTIYAITGGEVPVAKGDKKDDFNVKKSILIAKLHNFDKLVDDRNKSGLATNSRDYIRLKMTIQKELQDLTSAVEDLAETHKRELGKKGYVLPYEMSLSYTLSPFFCLYRNKLSAEEIEARKEVMESVISEFHTVYKAAVGHSHRGAEENIDNGAGLKMMTSEQLRTGKFSGAGISRKREEMTGEQMMMLQEIQGVRKEQDAILDAIADGLDDLKEIGERMFDELQLQDKMLEDLDEKTDKAQGKLDRTNDRMADALKKLNDKSSKMCMYLICIVLLLGLASVAYKLATKK